MDKTLQIKPEFEQIIPPLSKEEFAQLEENILKLGKITDPIQVWKGFIVDGHQRYKILQKHPEIIFTTFEMDFESEEEAIAWRCTAQLVGVLSKTKHNEGAPCQHEMAPIYTNANTACDDNQLVMEIMKKCAAKHNLAKK